MTRTPPVDAKAPPAGRTARRLDWMLLPPALRDTVERRLGSPVESHESMLSGFTPGMASVLTCADGTRHFVKAANGTAQRAFADCYREEIRKLATLPSDVPAPRLLWSMDDDWVVLELEYVDGRLPQRPWQPDELELCLDALESTATALTPPPSELTDTIAQDFAPVVEAWRYARRALPDLPHAAEAEALAARHAELAGDTLVHNDVRDDNLIIDHSGAVWICDWNWPVRGAAWVDTVCLLVQAYGDGLDAEALLASRPMTREVDADLVDVLLAVLAGFFFQLRDNPVPNSSPHLRMHQNWCAEVTWAWLCERRGW